MDRLDRGDRLDRLRHDLQDALVGRDRGLVVAQLVLLDLGAAEQQRDLEILLLRLAGDLIVERRHLGPLAQAPRQPIELAVGDLVARVLAHRARLAEFARRLLDAGFSREELKVMMIDNPGRLANL